MKNTLILAFALLASLLTLSSCNKKSDSEKDDDANKTKIVLEIDESDLGHPVTNADAKSAANAIRNRLRGLNLKNLKVTADDSKHIVVTTSDTENIERAVELAQRSTYVAFCPTFKKYEINFGANWGKKIGSEEADQRSWNPTGNYKFTVFIRDWYFGSSSVPIC